jgi:hypothetical protein
MPVRVWWTVLVVMATTAATAAGQVKLQWKLKEGDTLYAETVTSLQGTVSEGGAEPVKKNMLVSVHTLVIRFKVEKVTHAGYVLEEKITFAREKTSGGVVSMPQAFIMRNLAFTARKDKPEDKAKEVTFSVTISLSGQVLRFDGYAEGMKKIVKQFDDEPAQRKEQLGGETHFRKVLEAVTEEYLKRSVEQVFVGFPKDPMSPKTTWERRATDSLGEFGSLDSRYRYTYVGARKGEENVKVRATMKYLLPPPTGTLPFRITAGKLEADRAAGMIRFGARAGRVIRSEMKVHFTGALTVKSGKRKATLRLALDQTAVTRVLSENPLP